MISYIRWFFSLLKWSIKMQWKLKEYLEIDRNSLKSLYSENASADI